jgi:hypothetical protein
MIYDRGPRQSVTNGNSLMIITCMLHCATVVISMTIGTALVVIAVLYLIDRHKIWKESAITALAVVVLAAMVGATWYEYKNWYAPRKFNLGVRHAQSLKLCVPADPKDTPASPWVPVLTPDNVLRCVDADKVSLEVPPNRIVTSQADVAIWQGTLKSDQNAP